jgi:hypothetical protein
MGQGKPTTVFSHRAGKSRSHRILRALQLTGTTALALAMLAGCSSISDSVSSPFKWSSDSSKSSSGGKEQSYRNDIRDYTEAYLRSSGDLDAFRNGLASVAAKHGITNWEADQATFAGIGEGLGKARASYAQLEVYKTDLSRGDVLKAAAIQEGFEKYRTEKS